MKKYHGNCWPKDRHLYLMQAALLEGDAAIAAWEKWLVELDIDTIDHPSYQIIPKLYKNLKKLNISHPHMKIFEGVYRRTWVENQKNFYAFSSLVKKLREYGIEDIVLLKGGAMTLAYYQDFGIRPMGDIDFLVSKKMALKTLLQIIELGFKPAPPLVHIDIGSLEDKIKMQHAINFIGPDEYNQLCIDIHWSILYDIPENKINEGWIRCSDPHILNEVNLSTLNATYLLYQTCLHGAKYSPVPLTRWVMDAMTLIHLNKDSINWNELMASARADGHLLALRDTLSYLIRYFNADIPASFMRQLESSQFLLLEKLDVTLKRHAMLSLLLIPARLWNEHSRAMGKNHFLSKLMFFPKYLQKRCGLSQLWHLPFLLPIKVLQTLKRRFV